jgi:peroxiredoxin
MNRKEITVSWKILLPLFIVGGIAIALPTFLGRTEQGSADLAVQAEELGLEVSPVQGGLAPDFTLQTVTGETVQLTDLRGQPVLINLWATWCAPCRLEMPAIQDRFERYQDEGMVVLAVNFDESAEQVEAFRDELGLTFDLLLDPGAEVQQLYLNRSYPASFFIDAEGVIQVHHLGVMTEGQLDQNLATIGLGG